jgi:glycosyltransferase involved in cell wall biosynthesis
MNRASAIRAVSPTVPECREDDDASRPRLLLMATVSITVGSFLRPLALHMSAAGFDVHVVSAPGKELDALAGQPRVTVHAVPMERRVSLLRDLISLARLCRVFLRIRPDIVHANTPKAGLLGMVAAFLTGVRVRVLTIHGLPRMTQTGWLRRVLGVTDKITCLLATRILTVSHSLREATIACGLARPERVETLGYGSNAGLDTRRFDPHGSGAGTRHAVRDRYGIPRDALVVGYVGRLVRDKGIRELSEAWSSLRDEFPEARLLLCGAFEAGDKVPQNIRGELLGDDRVHFTGGFVDDVVPVYSAIDICVLPSYREGLPTVCLEAGLMKVPVVATRIPGCVDAVEDGVTGLLVEPGSQDAIANALRRLIEDHGLRRQMGEAGRTFVSRRFSEETVCGLLLAEYGRLLASSGLPVPVAGLPPSKPDDELHQAMY